MNSHVFLWALATVLVVAALTTVVFQRLKQPVVLGYILAGLIVGPHVPFPLVADLEAVQTLSELGVILLMFSLGLEFSLRRLVQVGPTAGLTAVIECSLLAWLGYLAGQWLGWTDLESLFAGAAVSISSTTIIAKAFEEQKVLGRLRELVVGILIVEDLIAVLMMAVLSAVAAGGGLGTATLTVAGGRLAAFLAAMLGLGLILVPRATRAVLRLQRPETTVVAALGFCFLCALLAMGAGYSVALGAFLAGSLVAEGGEGRTVDEAIRPVKDVFAAVFFVSVGMLLDPQLVLKHWQAVLLLSALVLLGKVLGVTLGAFLTGNGVRTSTQAGMSLAQIGEFSFIIAGLGLSLKATGHFLYPVAVAVSALTTLLTPYLIHTSGPVAEWLDRRLPKRLQTFSALYGSWTEKLQQSPDRAAVGARARSLLKMLAWDGLAIVLVAAAAAAFRAKLTGLAQQWLGLGVGSAKFVAPLLTLLLSFPFILGIVRVTGALGALLSEAVFPRVEQGLDLGSAPRRAMLGAVQWVTMLLVGMPMLALTQPLLHGWQAAGLLALLLGSLALAFWRHASDLHGHVRAGSQLLAEAFKTHLLETRSGPDRPPASLPELPGLGEPLVLHLEAASPALGRSLAELNLRGATGATALAIIHADGHAKLPEARELLAPGDALVLAGSRAALLAAQELLGSKPPA